MKLIKRWNLPRESSVSLIQGTRTFYGHEQMGYWIDVVVEGRKSSYEPGVWKNEALAEREAQFIATWIGDITPARHEPSAWDLHPFRDELKRWLSTESAISLLPKKLLKTDGLRNIWTQGGCWILADGLKKWIGTNASLVAVWGVDDIGEWIVQHAAIRVGSAYIDGELGVGSLGGMLDYWSNMLGVSTMITADSKNALDDMRSGFLRERQPTTAGSNRFAAALRVHFGNPSDWNLAHAR